MFMKCGGGKGLHQCH